VRPGTEFKVQSAKCKVKNFKSNACRGGSGGGAQHQLRAPVGPAKTGQGIQVPLPRAFRVLAFVLNFALCTLTFALPRASRADDSPKYAERGLSAYYAGKYDLARMFFSKALQDAVLKGKDEWVAKATFNLVDLELESGNESEAGRLLDGASTRDRGVKSVWLWKRSQLAFAQRHYPSAVELVDSALDLAKGDAAKQASMGLDRMRYLIQSREVSAWASQYETFRKGVGRERSAPVDAMAAMARKDYAAADTLWREAMGYYRKQGRLAKMAGCLNQSALCLFSQGRRVEAVETNARAVAVYGELGLEIPGLKAQALRLLLIDDDRQLAKLRQDMDLVGQRFSGFDLQGILDEYSQNLRDTRPGLRH
jgi:tetratricopeptide (TPR) repeat protein